MKSSEECIEYYKKDAKLYDKRRFSCACQQVYDAIFKEAVYNHLKDCKYVLDAGTGTGRFAIYLAGKGINVVAIDTSEEMLKIAKEAAVQQGVAHKIRFVLGDIERMPFNSEVFDGICSIHVLIHFASRNKALAEFSRVLKSHGVIVFEVANKSLSKFYYELRNRLGFLLSFPDYHYSVKEVEKILQSNNVRIAENKKIIKIPRIIVHFLFCWSLPTFLSKVVEKLECINMGLISIVKARKDF